jgi:excisionase family DNA binding protein
METQASSRRVFYTVQEAADRLQCSDKTVYRKLKMGELRGGRGPGGIRLDRAYVDMLIDLILQGKT